MSRPSQREIDAALSGAPAPGFERLSGWADEMRGLSAEPAAGVAATHITSMAGVAAALPVSVPAAVKSSPVSRLRKRLVLSSLLSGMFAKVFAASVALATVTGGVAATGSLPDVIQDPIAGIYNSVGFDFPTSDASECRGETNADCSDSEGPDQEGPTPDPTGGGDDDGTGPTNSNGNKNGPDNTQGNKNGPGESNPNDPGENNGKGPGNNNGKGPGENNGKGPGNDKGKGPGNQDGGDEG